jgi:CHAD domain-containing protein
VAKRKIKWDERSTVAANARRILPKLAADYFEQVRRFLATEREPKELHRMRLASKRLRYTLELFRPCYGRGLEERLDALKKLQDALGDVNDAVSASELLSGRTAQKVQKFLSARAEEKAQEFRLHWTESFDAPNREKWWTGYLQRDVRTVGRKRAGIRKPPVRAKAAGAS